MSDDEEEAAGAVIPINALMQVRNRLPDARLPIRKKVAGCAPSCWHDATEVDGNARIVTCRNCGAVLDPIAVLENLARRFDELGFYLKERAKIMREVEMLMEERRKLRSSVRGMAKRRA